MSFTLRPNQLEGVERIEADRARRVIACAPTGCLSGSTVLKINRAGKTFDIELARLVKMFNGGHTIAGKGSVRRWDKDISTTVQRADGGCSKLGQIAAAYVSGEKVLYRLRTRSGRMIEATSEHPFMIEGGGWLTLGELRAKQALCVRGDRASASLPAKRQWYRLVSGLFHHPFAGRRNISDRSSSHSVPLHRVVAEAEMNGLALEAYVSRVRSGAIDGLRFLDPEVTAVHHKDENPLNNDPGNLQVMSHEEHFRHHARVASVLEKIKLDDIRDIRRIGVEQTFDLTMLDAPHNFIANEFVVHNSGKTIIAMELARRSIERGDPVTFIVPRKELIFQTCQKLDQWAPCGYGLLTANRKGQNLFAPIQVASLDTLVSRVVKRNNLELPKAGLVIMDECHLAITQLRMDLMAQYPLARIIGLSATPSRGDGRGLGMAFESLIEISDVRTLTEQGYLVPAEYYAPSTADLARIRLVAGEYNQKDAAQRMQPLLGDIVGSWMQRAGHLRTVMFAQNVSQSIYLADTLRREGVAAEHCDANTDGDERDAIFSRFRSGETQVLTNVNLATYGFDLPELECGVIAKLTRSIVAWLQMIGRTLRSAPGKTKSIIHDHGGAVHNLGKADDERVWTLDGLQYCEKGKRTMLKKERKAPRRLTCPKCSNVFEGSLTCPACKYYFEAKAKEFYVVEGELVPFQEPKEAVDPIVRMRWFCELKSYAANKGYKPGWAAYTYKDKFGGWPPREWTHYAPIEPSTETLRYIRHLFIKKAKSREAEQRRMAG